MESVDHGLNEELAREAANSQPLTKRRAVPKGEDQPDVLPDERKYHKTVYRRKAFNIDDMKVLTPEGLVNELDSKGKRWLKRSKIHCLIGRTESGKSYFLKQLMYYILKDKSYWDVAWVEAYSGSAKTTEDLDFLHPDQIHETYDDLRFRYQLHSSYEQQKKLKAANSKAELQHGIVIIDDQIGVVDLKRRAVDLHAGDAAQTWKYLGTRGRRLPVTEFVLVQAFQWINNICRDGAGYLYCVSVSGSQFDHLWDQVMHTGLWNNKTHFRDWCNSYLTQFQILVFNMHSTESEDLVRLVKAFPDQEKNFRIHMQDSYKEEIISTRKRAKDKIQETERAFKRAQEKENA